MYKLAEAYCFGGQGFYIGRKRLVVLFLIDQKHTYLPFMKEKKH